MAPAVTADFEWRQAPAGRVLVAAPLMRVAPHLFSSRDASPPGVHAPDYQAIAGSLGMDASDVVRVRQVHGRDVLVVREGDVIEPLAEADALVTTDPARVVSVRVADCVPILIADRGRRAVAAVHAGWRGTANGVVTAAVEALEALGIPASDLIAAIGPSIGPCCYQVDARVREDFARRYPGADSWFTPDGDARWRLDLWCANEAQLESAGVSAGSILRAATCTADGLSHWYSHRKEGAAAGRMVAAIRLAAR
jgi:YfiH family protein